jgi:hypothetical protein
MRAPKRDRLIGDFYLAAQNAASVTIHASIWVNFDGTPLPLAVRQHCMPHAPRRGIHHAKMPIPRRAALFNSNRWRMLVGIRFDLLLKNKRHLHLHTVLRDLSFVIEQNFLILDPCGSDFFKSFPGASKT